jgi:hypothetical protein
MLLIPSFLKKKTIPIVIDDVIHALKLTKYNFINQYKLIKQHEVLITNPDFDNEKKNNSLLIY